MPRIKQIIAINNSGVEVFINDLGISIPIASQRDLFKEFNLEELDKSDDLKTHVLAENIIINDGDENITANEALSHLKIESEWSDYADEGVEVQQDGVVINKARIINFTGSTVENVTIDSTTGKIDVQLKEFTDSTSGELTFVDPTTGQTLGASIIEVCCGRDRKINNSYFRTIDGTAMNQVGIPLPYNATLVYFTMSNEKATKTWTAQVRKNDTTIIHDSLTIDHVLENHSIIQNENFYAGDRIQIYCNGETERAQVRLYFRRRF